MRAQIQINCQLLTHIFYIVLKGNSSHLMKPGAKRRRSKAQIAEEKKQAELKEAEIAAKLAQFDQIRNQVADM